MALLFVNVDVEGDCTAMKLRSNKSHWCSDRLRYGFSTLEFLKLFFGRFLQKSVQCKIRLIYTLSGYGAGGWRRQGGHLQAGRRVVQKRRHGSLLRTGWSGVARQALFASMPGDCHDVTCFNPCSRQSGDRCGADRVICVTLTQPRLLADPRHHFGERVFPSGAATNQVWSSALTWSSARWNSRSHAGFSSLSRSLMAFTCCASWILPTETFDSPPFKPPWEFFMQKSVPRENNSTLVFLQKKISFAEASLNFSCSKKKMVGDK